MAQKYDLYVLLFNEWGWDEGEGNSPQILGVFNEREFAENAEAEAKGNNDHGDYNIKPVRINEVAKYGW